MPLLSLNRVSKAYIVENILEEVSFQIKTDEKIGLVGVNGSGKTTLFEILVGNISLDSGQIIKPKDLTIGYLKQESTVDNDKTIYENCLEVFEDLDKIEDQLREMEREMAELQGEELEILMNRYSHLMDRFEEAGGYGRESAIRGTLVGLGFATEEFDQPANTLSGGQKARLGLAKLLLSRPDLLLLDEPTNHLDMDAIQWLEKFLREYKGTVLVISHDRYFLDRVVSRIFLLENKKIYTYDGNYTEFMKRRKQDLDIQMRAYENQQAKIAKEEAIIRRYENWRREKSLIQARSRQKKLDKLERIEAPQMHHAQANIKFDPKKKSGKDVLHVEELSMSFEEPLFENLAFDIYRGEKVGLIGPNGIGKSTLFHLIMKDYKPDTGTINIGAQVEIGYFDQEMESLTETNTILEEVWNAYPELDRYHIRKALAQFLFFEDDLEKTIDSLSGGEKGRLSLLKLMLSRANFLLLDEPTNHLDIDAKEKLEEALIDYTGTLLAISHDRYFLNHVCTKILAMTSDGVIAFSGNYDYYLEKMEELHQEEEPPEELSKTQQDKDRKQRRQSQREARKRRLRIQELEEEVQELEQNLEEIDQILADPQTYEKDHTYSLELTEKREVLAARYDEVFEAWCLAVEDEDIDSV